MKCTKKKEQIKTFICYPKDLSHSSLNPNLQVNSSMVGEWEPVKEI